MPSYGEQGKEAVIHQLQQCIFQLHPEKIEGIGIGTPGTVDVLQGQILDVGGNINDWSYCNLKSEMQSFFPDDKFYILNNRKKISRVDFLCLFIEVFLFHKFIRFPV